MSDQAQGLRQMMEGRQPLTKTRVISVTSGKGGVGKTNLAANLGIELADRGYRVGILDADMGLANVDIVLGVVPKFTLGDVIYGQKTLAETMVEGPRGLKVFAGGAGIYELANLSQWRLERFVRNLTELDNELDFVIIDTGAGISRTVLSFLLASEEVIVVTTPEPTAITDAYSVIKVIASQGGLGEVGVVVNMAANANQAENVFRKLNMVVDRFLASKLNFMGYVPMDSAVPRSVTTQQPFRLLYPHSKASMGIMEIADGILGDVPEDTGGMSRLINKMAKILGKSAKR